MTVQAFRLERSIFIKMHGFAPASEIFLRTLKFNRFAVEFDH